MRYTVSHSGIFGDDKQTFGTLADALEWVRVILANGGKCTVYPA
jgi:hypothetical protein